MMKNVINVFAALLLVLAIAGCKKGGWSCSGSSCYSVEGGDFASQSSCESYCSSNGGGGGGGGNNCTYSTYSGSSCSSGYVQVSATTCCPSSSPYWCSGTNNCYSSCASAAANCSGSVVLGSYGSGGGGGGGGGGSTGQLMVWTATDWQCGTISVSCGGYSGGVSQYYYSGTPSCGASGCATFTLAPGTYTVSASCSSRSWPGGTYTVTAGGCNTVKLN